MEKPTGVGRASLPETHSTAAIWRRLLERLPFGAFRSVLACHCRLEAEHLHGLTIAAPSCWLPLLGERRDLLERAAHAATGKRLAVHLVATDAETAGGRK